MRHIYTGNHHLNQAFSTATATARAVLQVLTTSALAGAGPPADLLRGAPTPALEDPGLRSFHVTRLHVTSSTKITTTTTATTSTTAERMATAERTRLIG